MAIAFDAISSQDYGGVSSGNLAHTCSGSNRLLLVGIQVGANTNPSSAPTYNGVAMTLVANNYVLPLGTDQRILLYHLLNPSTGTNNISVSWGSSLSFSIRGYSYTGVKQTGFPDASNNDNQAQTVNSLATSVTTVANNSWAFLIARANQNISAGASTTRRDTSSLAFVGCDTNGAVTPAGSRTLTTTTSTNTAYFAHIMVSFAPVTSTNWTQTLTETPSLTDSVLKRPTRTLSENRSVTDSLLKQPGKLASDGLALTDSFLRFPQRLLTDALAPADMLLREARRTLAENSTIADLFTALKVRFKELTESLPIADTVARAIARTIAETATVADTIYRTASRTLSDTVTTADSLVRAATKVLSHSMVVLDSAIRSLSRSMTESVGIVQIYVKEARKILSESTSLTDTIVRSLVLVRTFIESLTVTDRIKKHLNGLNSLYSRKYEDQGTTYEKKYPARGTSYEKKYPD